LKHLLAIIDKKCCDSRVEEEKKEETKKDGSNKQMDIGKEAAIEAEVRAARERATIPLEIWMKQFRDMLTEKQVCVCSKSIVTQNYTPYVLA